MNRMNEEFIDHAGTRYRLAEQKAAQYFATLPRSFPGWVSYFSGMDFFSGLDE